MRRVDQDCFWLVCWAWDIGDTEARIELNPLNISIGVGMGPLGVRFDLPFVCFGLVWGPHCGSEEHERAVLQYLKKKYGDGVKKDVA